MPKNESYVPAWMKEGQATARALTEEIIATSAPGEAVPTFVQEFLDESKKETPLFGMTTPSLDPSFKLKYDGSPLPLDVHLMELWARLRKIARIVFLLTFIIMVIPSVDHGKLAIDPYRPFVLDLLNYVVTYGVQSLQQGSRNITVYVGTPIASISLYINFAASIAILISLPVTVRELYAYVRPGLTKKEDEVLKQISLVASALFLLGAFISFTTIIPVTLKILSITSTFIKNVQPWFDLQSVLAVLIWGTIGAGILYASPMVLVALVQLDLISAEQISSRRREMIFGVFTLAAIVTPDPTLISMVILSLPMVFVIEGVILWSLRIETKRYLDEYGKILI